MGLFVRDFEKVQVDNTLQAAWFAAYRDYLKLHEPIVLDEELRGAIQHADKVVESLKKCRYG